MNSKLAKFAALGAFSLAAAYGTQAHALVLEIAGGFVIDSAIPAGVVAYGGQAGNNVLADAPIGTTTHIEWIQDLTPVSELDLNNLAPVTINPGDTDVVFQTTVQTNNVIPQATAWNDMGLAYNLVVSADGSAGSELFDVPIFAEVDFIETLNSGDCPLGNPNGSICDDRYIVTLENLGAAEFMDDDFIYSMVIGFTEGPNTTITPLGGGQFEIFTGEDEFTQINLVASLTAVAKPIPEPATLTLIGLGLAGLGFSARKKKQS